MQTLQLPFVKFLKNGKELVQSVCIGKTGPHGCCGFTGQNGQVFGVPYKNRQTPICYKCYQNDIQPNEDYKVVYDKKSINNRLCICTVCDMYCTVHENFSKNPICYSCRNEQKQTEQDQIEKILRQFKEETEQNQKEYLMENQKVENIVDILLEEAAKLPTNDIEKVESIVDILLEEAAKLPTNDILVGKIRNPLTISNGLVSMYSKYDYIGQSTDRFVNTTHLKIQNMMKDRDFKQNLYNYLLKHIGSHQIATEFSQQQYVIGICESHVFHLNDDDYYELIKSQIPISYINYSNDTQANLIVYIFVNPNNIDLKQDESILLEYIRNLLQVEMKMNQSINLFVEDQENAVYVDGKVRLSNGLISTYDSCEDGHNSIRQYSITMQQLCEDFYKNNKNKACWFVQKMNDQANYIVIGRHGQNGFMLSGQEAQLLFDNNILVSEAALEDEQPRILIYDFTGDIDVQYRYDEVSKDIIEYFMTRIQLLHGLFTKENRQYKPIIRQQIEDYDFDNKVDDYFRDDKYVQGFRQCKVFGSVQNTFIPLDNKNIELLVQNNINILFASMNKDHYNFVVYDLALDCQSAYSQFLESLNYYDVEMCKFAQQYYRQVRK